MTRYAEWEREHGYIRTRFTLRSEGGRSSPVFDDDRCDWNLRPDESDLTLNGGPITIEEGGQLAPGETAVVRIHPMAPEYWTHIQPNMEINAHEGPRVVGADTILEVVPPQTS